MTGHRPERQWPMFKEECRELGHEGEKRHAPAGQCVGRDRSACVSPQVEATGGHRVARQDERAGVRSAKVRLSTAAHPAEARRLDCELDRIDQLRGYRCL